MNGDSLTLLKETSSGCQMGIDSMEQVAEFVEDIKLLKVLDNYKRKHQDIMTEIRDLLETDGKEPEKPGKLASMMSWVTTEMKLSIENDNTQVSKVLMDGCNMGIQTLTEKMHQLKNAEKESVKITESLIELEKEFHQELQRFL